MTDLIEIEIDGKKIQAKPEQTVIQAADEAGIYIPRFCYHKNLSIAANCRMCLVDVEKAPKPMPACALPLAPGLKVSTKSPKALAAQRAVMEFLLINHPLDCPICDQGGECELQDLAMGYGAPKSHYCETKRAVADKDIGPLVATEMTRCIQCTRCVRFGDEVAGLRELGAVNRGEEMEITTYVQHALQSEVSGNIIDLCPVGALTAKPSRFRARAWELTQVPSVSPHDCVGSNLNVHLRRGKVIRVVSRENAAVNEMWIADRDRFSYEGLSHKDRMKQPMVKLDGHWEKTDWLPALDYAVGGLRRVMATSTGDQLAALASPNSTLEELYLLQKLLRGLGSSNIDHRLRQTDFRDQSEMPLLPGLDTPLAELENADSILLIGSNIPKEQPIAALRLRKAYLKGAAISALNPMDYRFHFRLKAKKIVAPDELAYALAGVAKVLVASLKEPDPKLASLFSEVVIDDTHRAIAEHLKNSKKGFVLVGSLAFNHPQASLLRRLARLIAEATHTQLGFLTEGANAAGAWLAGAVPHRRAGGKINTQVGLHASAMLEKNRKGYILLNMEPDLDCANPVLTRSALKQADFVVAFSAFDSPALQEVANVILPIAPFTETSGTFVNAAGEWQSFKAVASLLENAQPGWKALSSMANLFQLPGFRYESAEPIREEVRAAVAGTEFKSAKTSWKDVTIAAPQGLAISRIGEIPLYAIDGLVRRAKALQATQKIVEGELAAIRLHPVFAKELNFLAGETLTINQKKEALRLPLILDERVPLRAAWIAGGINETVELSELFGTVELTK
jgi:NADH-quinone oxidoreductase subunit G